MALGSSIRHPLYTGHWRGPPEILLSTSERSTGIVMFTKCMTACLVKGNSVIRRGKKLPAPGPRVPTTYVEGESANATEAKLGSLSKASLEAELAATHQGKHILKPPRMFF